MAACNPSSSATVYSLHEWYRVKPFALQLFDDHTQDKYWIKNAWILALNNEECRKSMDIPEHSDTELSRNEKLWMLALYELFWHYKSAIDFDPWDYDLESWCNNLDIKFQKGDEEYYQDMIKEPQRLFKASVCSTYPDSYDRHLFMNNSVMVISQDEYLRMMSNLKEMDIDTEEDFYILEEDQYLDYCHELIIPGNENSAFDWVAEVMR